MGKKVDKVDRDFALIRGRKVDKVEKKVDKVDKKVDKVDKKVDNVDRDFASIRRASRVHLLSI